MPLGPAAIVQRLGKLRVDLQRHVEVGHRTLEITLGLQREAAVVVGVLVVRSICRA